MTDFLGLEFIHPVTIELLQNNKWRVNISLEPTQFTKERIRTVNGPAALAAHRARYGSHRPFAMEMPQLAEPRRTFSGASTFGVLAGANPGSSSVILHSNSDAELPIGRFVQFPEYSDIYQITGIEPYTITVDGTVVGITPALKTVLLAGDRCDPNPFLICRYETTSGGFTSTTSRGTVLRNISVEEA